MGQDISQVQLYGPAKVLIGGVDVGHLSEDGAKITIKNKIVEAKAAKYGDSPVSKWLDGQRCEVDFTVIQTDRANFTALASAIPGSTVVTGGSGTKKMTFGKIAGTQLSAVALKLTPQAGSQSPSYDFTAVAVPIGDFDVEYKGGDFTKVKCKFGCVINESGAADGSYLFTLGDTSITLDVTAPVVSGVVPLDAAANVSVSTAVTWTISKVLDGNTVSTASVRLFKDPTGSGATGLAVTGTVVLTNSGASTTIVFTPGSALTGATKYIATLEGVKDQAGNLLASGFYATEFTTA